MDTPTARGLLQGLVGQSPSPGQPPAGEVSCITITPIYYGVKRTTALLASPASATSNDHGADCHKLPIKAENVDPPDKAIVSSPIIQRLLTPQPAFGARQERKSRFHAEAMGLKAGPAAGATAMPHSVRVKIAEPVRPGVRFPARNPRAGKCTAQEQEITVQPLASPVQLSQISPLAGWIKGEERSGPSQLIKGNNTELVHVSASDELDLGAHFRAQPDSTTPEFGFLVHRQEDALKVAEVHIATSLPRNVYALMLNHIKGGAYDSPAHQKLVEQSPALQRPAGEIGPRMLAFDSPGSQTEYGTPSFSVTASFDDFGTPIPDLFAHPFQPGLLQMTPAESFVGSSSSPMHPEGDYPIQLLPDRGQAERYTGLSDSGSPSTFADSSEDGNTSEVDEAVEGLVGAVDAMSACRSSGCAADMQSLDTSNAVKSPAEGGASKTALAEGTPDLNFWTARKAEVPTVPWQSPDPDRLKVISYLRELGDSEELKTPLPQAVSDMMQHMASAKRPPLPPQPDSPMLEGAHRSQAGNIKAFWSQQATPGPDINELVLRPVENAKAQQLGDQDFLRALEGLAKAKDPMQEAMTGGAAAAAQCVIEPPRSEPDPASAGTQPSEPTDLWSGVPKLTAVQSLPFEHGWSLPVKRSAYVGATGLTMPVADLNSETADRQTFGPMAHQSNTSSPPSPSPFPSPLPLGIEASTVLESASNPPESRTAESIDSEGGTSNKASPASSSSEVHLPREDGAGAHETDMEGAQILERGTEPVEGHSTTSQAAGHEVQDSHAECSVPTPGSTTQAPDTSASSHSEACSAGSNPEACEVSQSDHLPERSAAHSSDPLDSFSVDNGGDAEAVSLRSWEVPEASDTSVPLVQIASDFLHSDISPADGLLAEELSDNSLSSEPDGRQAVSPGNSSPGMEAREQVEAGNEAMPSATLQSPGHSSLDLELQPDGEPTSTLEASFTEDSSCDQSAESVAAESADEGEAVRQLWRIASASAAAVAKDKLGQSATGDILVTTETTEQAPEDALQQDALCLQDLLAEGARIEEENLSLYEEVMQRGHGGEPGALAASELDKYLAKGKCLLKLARESQMVMAAYEAEECRLQCWKTHNASGPHASEPRELPGNAEPSASVPEREMQVGAAGQQLRAEAESDLSALKPQIDSVTTQLEQRLAGPDTEHFQQEVEDVILKLKAVCSSLDQDKAESEKTRNQAEKDLAVAEMCKQICEDQNLELRSQLQGGLGLAALVRASGKECSGPTLSCSQSGSPAVRQTTNSPGNMGFVTPKTAPRTKDSMNGSASRAVLTHYFTPASGSCQIQNGYPSPSWASPFAGEGYSIVTDRIRAIRQELKDAEANMFPAAPTCLPLTDRQDLQEQHLQPHSKADNSSTQRIALLENLAHPTAAEQDESVEFPPMEGSEPGHFKASEARAVEKSLDTLFREAASIALLSSEQEEDEAACQRNSSEFIDCHCSIQTTSEEFRLPKHARSHSSGNTTGMSSLYSQMSSTVGEARPWKARAAAVEDSPKLIDMRSQLSKEQYLVHMAQILDKCRQAQAAGTNAVSPDTQKMVITVLENGLLQRMNVLPYLPPNFTRKLV